MKRLSIVVRASGPSPFRPTMRVFATLAAASSLVALSSAYVHPREHYEQLFVDWMMTHNMRFENGFEFAHRLGVFADNHGEWPSSYPPVRCGGKAAARIFRDISEVLGGSMTFVRRPCRCVVQT